MRKIWSVFPLIAVLAACAGQPSQPTAQAAKPAEAPRPKTAEEVAKAEFDRREVSLAVAAALRQQAAAQVNKRLYDAGSAQYRFDLTSANGAETAVCGAVSAKGSDGLYAGFTRFYVVLAGGAAKEVGLAGDGPETMRQLIAYCDESAPEAPSYPKKALEK